MQRNEIKLLFVLILLVPGFSQSQTLKELDWRSSIQKLSDTLFQIDIHATIPENVSIYSIDSGKDTIYNTKIYFKKCINCLPGEINETGSSIILKKSKDLHRYICNLYDWFSITYFS